MCVSIADMGLSVLVMRYIVTNYKDVKTVFSSAICLCVFSILIIFLILTVNYGVTRIISVSMLISTTLIISILDGVSRAKEDMVKFSQWGTLSYFSAIIVLGTLLYTQVEMPLDWVFYILAIFQLFIIFKFFHSYDLWGFFSPSRPMIIKLLRSGLVISLATLGANLYIRTIILYLDGKDDLVWLSYIDIFEKIFFMFAFPIAIYGQVVSRNNIKNNGGNIKISSLIKSFALFYIPLFLVFYGVSYFVVDIVFSDEKSFAVPLIIFSLVVPLRVVNTYYVQSYFYPNGMEKIVMLSLVFFGVLNFLLLDFIYLRYNVVGILTLTSIMFLLSIITQLYCVKRKINR